jgi:hypothetical protein
MRLRLGCITTLSDGSQTLYFGDEHDERPNYSFGAPLMLNVGPGGRLRAVKKSGRMVFSRMNGTTKVKLASAKVKAASELALKALAAQALGVDSVFEIDI